MKAKEEPGNNRRKFLRNTFALGTVALASTAGKVLAADDSDNKKTEKIKVLTTDGQVIEVDKPADNCKINPFAPAQGDAARQGIPGRSFVMVIDLARCKNARKCIEGCQEGHNLKPDQEWLNVALMKDNPEAEPYWFPRQCFHCDNPPCVKVCPVGATFKRQDNLVLIDNERCIGCKFCVVACPYSARIFNWEKPNEPIVPESAYSPETSIPHQIGTVSKCDFCADRSREGKLPYCATSCPMGVIYFGDRNEDAVSNGTETVRFSQLIKERAGYRYLEELGTKPNVYYLPPVNKMFDYESGLKDLPEEQQRVYDDLRDGNKSNK
ncbi:MAG: 4Fe-4S dicluster domain-containing protein [Cyclobacteriaceae bacterium]|nr:4Fe-4S dicluster domain-containing protein [Cyclobacteriaceae bacterium]